MSLFQVTPSLMATPFIQQNQKRSRFRPTGGTGFLPIASESPIYFLRLLASRAIAPAPKSRAIVLGSGTGSNAIASR